MSVSVMKKLTVIAPSGDEDAIIKRLMRSRCVEVRSSRADDYGYLLEDLSCDSKLSEAERKIATIEKIIPVLIKRTKRLALFGPKRVKVDRDEFICDGRYDNAWKMVADTNDAISRISECRSQMLAADSEIASLTPWISYGLEANLEGTKYTNITLGVLPAGTKISAAEAAMDQLIGGIEVIGQDSKGIYVSLITHKNDTDKVLTELANLGFLKVAFKNIDKTPTEAIIDLQNKKLELENEIDTLDQLISDCANKLGDIEILWDIENTSLVAIQSKQNMAKTQECVVLSGWMPEESGDKVKAELDGLCCAYGIYDALPGEEPPVHLSNNGFASNFEWVVGMYSYPKYGSFDPTLIMSVFYFFMFGLMFADVGYGLLLTLGGFLGPKLLGLKPNMKRSFNMFGYCGIASMIMGVIFGGWFGDMPYALMENYFGMTNARETVPFFNGIWFNPVEDPMTFLIISLAVGGVHLIAGMVVKFVLLCREGKVFDAIFDIASWWIIFAGIAVIVLIGMVPGAIICGLGVLMIVCTHGRHEKNFLLKIGKGLLGLYDITSYASDLLSYSRILALGLAAAVIAQVINLMGTMMGPTVGGIIVLIVASIIGHALNLAINILGSFVHTSRLQYLEFFSKFYEDGGREFKAMEPSEKYTID